MEATAADGAASQEDEKPRCTTDDREGSSRHHPSNGADGRLELQSEPAAPDAAPVDVPPPSSLSRFLGRQFLYQDPRTGGASKHPLTSRQICRLLVPTTLQPQGIVPPPPSVITLDTQLLPLRDLTLEGEGGEGADEGHGDGGDREDEEAPYGEWQPAKTFPTFAAAAALWYYEEPPPIAPVPHKADAYTASATEGAEATTPVMTATVAGPVSCRDLARLVFHQQNDPSPSSPAFPSLGDWGRRRIYSDTAAMGMAVPAWTALADLPHLRTALAAFDVSYESRGGTLANQTGAKDPAPPDSPSVVVGHDRVRDELAAFLSSTDRLGPRGGRHDDDDESDDEAYESDGGTRYVKDPRTGNWVHEALIERTRSLAPTAPSNASKRPPPSGAPPGAAFPTKKKSKGSKFSAKHSRCWIYVTGLPPDTTEEELVAFCTKAGVLDLNPETLKPKIKLYRLPPSDGAPAPGPCKGDASVCYARPESVSLAVTLLDEAPFRPTLSVDEQQYRVRVEPAKFEARQLSAAGGGGGSERPAPPPRSRVSNAQRRVAKLAARQAVDWDGGDNNGRLTGGRKGLRIVVLKGVFDPAKLQSQWSDDATEDAFFAALEGELRDECEAFGEVEKMTVFSRNPEGVVVVKFAKPAAASDAVQSWHGRSSWKHAAAGRVVEAIFWDGVTDYTVRDEVAEAKEAEQRHEDFGKWLENQDLPEELQLKTE